LGIYGILWVFLERVNTLYLEDKSDDSIKSESNREHLIN